LEIESEKMKKIIISYDFLKEIGGLERVMFFQANKLSKKYSVELLFGHVENKEKEKIVKELGLNKGINIESKNRGREIKNLISGFIFPFRKLSDRSELIISHSFMCSRAAWKRKIKEKTPYGVVLNHPPNFLYDSNLKWANNLPRKFAYVLGLFGKPILKKIDKKSVKNADFIISNSKYTSNRVKKIYGINSEIVYPVLTREFKIISKKEIKRNLEKFNLRTKFVLLHGRMIKDKRPDLAVKAFYLLSNKIKDLDLVISGTIEEEKKIKKLITDLGIEKKVKISGKVSKEELVSLYNCAECFLMSAPKEDFGLTPIEAMACGTPVVAWKDGAGPEETVIEEENGFLAKPYSIEDFSKKIEICLNKRWNKEKISKSVDKFSERNIEKKLFEIVEKVI
jgi:glycosyltransferase involved in cell wall biosynthesis